MYGAFSLFLFCLDEIRLQELAQQNDNNSGPMSLESDMESEDEFDDAEAWLNGFV